MKPATNSVGSLGSSNSSHATSACETGDHPRHTLNTQTPVATRRALVTAMGMAIAIIEAASIIAGLNWKSVIGSRSTRSAL